MPGDNRSVLTTGRKLTANVLPLLLTTPLLVAAFFEYNSNKFSVLFYILLAGFPLVTWLAVNLIGLLGNAGMRDEISRRMHEKRPFDQNERYFVGFASPGYKNALDSHEDVGFLTVFEDHLEFYGGENEAVIPLSAVKGVTFRKNPHSWALLGRWVSVEAEIEGKPIRLLVEPREKATLLGNRAFSVQLRERLESWAKGGAV